MTLLEKIRYDGKSYNETTDAGKRAIEKTAARLQPWENELLAYPKATIQIQSSGVEIFDSFPRELMQKINKPKA